MEFLSFRRPDMNLKPAFLQQLSGYERRLMSTAERPFSLDWNEADFSRPRRRSQGVRGACSAMSSVGWGRLDALHISSFCGV